MRTATTWVCLLGFASITGFVACGGDDDDPAGGPGGSAGAGNGAAGSASGAGGSPDQAGQGGGNDAMLARTVALACHDRCTAFGALMCPGRWSVADCDRECDSFTRSLSTACLNALSLDYDCVERRGREAYVCDADGIPTIKPSRQCQPSTEGVATNCAGQLTAGSGGAAGAGGQGGRVNSPSAGAGGS